MLYKSTVFAKQEKLLAKRKQELEKWKFFSKQKKPFILPFYMMFIFCLAYVVDEIATNLNTVLQNYVLQDFFNYESGLTNYTIIITIASSISIFTFFFKALADRFGRKPFLVISVLGMSLGMFICFFSRTLPIYILGLLFLFFFTPADIQAVYILETSSTKRRAFNLALSRGIGIMGIALIAVFHECYASTSWHEVFLIPAIIGVVTGIIALAFARESDVFMENRIKTLTRQIKDPEDTTKKKQKKNVEDSQGGLINAIKYMLKNKYLLWLFIVLVLLGLCVVGQSNTALVMSEKQAIPEETTTTAYLVYPFICALVIFVNGIISDKCGRKISAIYTTAVALFGILFFTIGSRVLFPGVLLGLGLGAFLGGFQGALDTCNVMCSEQSPTNLRSSIMSVISMGMSVGSFLGTGILLLFNAIIPNLQVGILLICMLSPGLLIALILLIIKIPESKGKDLYKINSKD